MVDLPPPEGPTSASVLPTGTSRLRDPYTTSSGRAGCVKGSNNARSHGMVQAKTGRRAYKQSPFERCDKSKSNVERQGKR